MEQASARSDHGSAFFPLTGGSDSLGARLRMIDAAEESIDLQYFLMKDDIVGALISAKLLEAADRGVRVRFLLDDIFSSVKDVDLFVLNEHENIEVRLFNPIARQGFKLLNFAWDFARANRRMHNKSFTVDGSFTIVGGRNLAAEYFSLNDKTEFFDIDVLATGPIAAEVAASFDYFWNFPKALGIHHLRNKPSPGQMQKAREAIDNVFSSQGAAIYREAIDSQILLQLINNEVSDVVAEAELISENPLKLKLPVEDDSLRLIKAVGEYMLNAENEVLIITPYLIPTERGMALFDSILERGTRIRLVTNSLASTNQVAVHAHYEGYRQGLLAMGAELYETRADAFHSIGLGDSERQRSTLHAKMIIIDRRYVFIGSLNLDPRSVAINTELGIMIDSSELAEMLLTDIEGNFERVVYRLELDPDGVLLWHDMTREEVVGYSSEPQASWWRRFSTNFFKLLPEGQL
ncbi:MAG: phospholipase D family protein [Gammaproteobacteria bacterium]|nr:phospholipase D family protein [Gammaproteobacteria bacterium]